TIEILEGLTLQDSGDVEILGTPWREGAEGRALRERLGIQLQETQLADKLTVEETLAVFRSFYRHSHTVNEVLALVELEEKRRARVVTLSGGQKQRLAVACALVSKPDLLFLDEPTTGLDPQSRRQLWEIIRQFRAAGGTVLLRTLPALLALLQHRGLELASLTTHHATLDDVFVALTGRQLRDT